MQALNNNKALVLFSGGQDSSIALAYALDRFETVETIGFDYGQRHAVELGARSAIRRELLGLSPIWQDRLGQDCLVDLSGLGRISETAMTRDTAITVSKEGLPSTFVPGRNLIFLTYAGAHAYKRNAGILIGGMCEADYSGYPDCRADTLDAQMNAIRLGMDMDIRLESPLMNISKAESWHLARKIGGTDLVAAINEHSHTCYLGVRAERHDWGYGCGTCPACELRQKGWREYQAEESVV